MGKMDLKCGGRDWSKCTLYSHAYLSFSISCFVREQAGEHGFLISLALFMDSMSLFFKLDWLPIDLVSLARVTQLRNWLQQSLKSQNCPWTSRRRTWRRNWNGSDCAKRGDFWECFIQCCGYVWFWYGSDLKKIKYQFFITSSLLNNTQKLIYFYINNENINSNKKSSFKRKRFLFKRKS